MAETRPEADTPHEERPRPPFWPPRVWPVSLLWLVMSGLARIPLQRQIGFTRRLGWLLGRVRRKTRLIAERNLALCFPELSAADRASLLQRHFESLGASLSETAIAWFAPREALRPLVRVQGREHIEHAVAAGHGVILYSAHFTSLELGLAVLRDIYPSCAGMYHPPARPALESLMRYGRSRAIQEQIARDNVRRLVRRLKEGAVVVYVPDQTHAGGHSALIPFFGEMAVTNTATSTLARLSGAIVIPYFFRRLPGPAGYVVDIGPPVRDFPSADPIEDSRKLVALLEDYIRKAPEQYLWTYRKFRNRPAEFPNAYADLGQQA
jgi:KDO2-lipid IV(A) lauroyltransferase